MDWNLDFSSAPHDRKIWIATKCGKVSATSWVEKRGQWAGLADKEVPRAWQPYIVPKHPDAGVIVHHHENINLPIVEDAGSGA